MDVASIGGSFAGPAAAVASAREGAATCLVEGHRFLGGTATAALVGQFQERPSVNGEPDIVGLYAEIYDSSATTVPSKIASFITRC